MSLELFFSVLLSTRLQLANAATIAIKKKTRFILYHLQRPGQISRCIFFGSQLTVEADGGHRAPFVQTTLLCDETAAKPTIASLKKE
jgi:hypothetical protein